MMPCLDLWLRADIILIFPNLAQALQRLCCLPQQKPQERELNWQLPSLPSQGARLSLIISPRGGDSTYETKWYNHLKALSWQQGFLRLESRVLWVVFDTKCAHMGKDIVSFLRC